MTDRAFADGPLRAELETALLRALAATFTELNDGYFKGKLRPPVITLSDAATRLGQWERASRTLTLSRALVLRSPWGVTVEVLKHELAHQFVCEVLGEPDDTAHGPAFQAVCEAHGIDATAAGLPASEGVPTASADEARVLQRVARLLALAESPNEHEAELAMAEAQRLMLVHNIQRTARARYTFRHLGAPTGRVRESERILAGILGDHFFVESIWVPVWRPHEGKRGSVLEVCGTRMNLEIAEHTWSFLTHTADRLWERYKRERGLRGDRERRTFLAGVMLGFRDKLDAQRERSAAEGLVWVGDGDLERYWRRRHPHVRWTRHSGNRRTEAHAHGRAAGRQIVLHKAVAAAQANRGRLLGSGR